MHSGHNHYDPVGFHGSSLLLCVQTLLGETATCLRGPCYFVLTANFKEFFPNTRLKVVKH